jgi:hypothetical protein
MAMLAGIIMPRKMEATLDSSLASGLFFGCSALSMTFDLSKVSPFITH